MNAILDAFAADPTHPTHALALALAELRQEMPTDEDVADAALVRREMQQVGWDVRRVHRPEDGGRREMALAVALGKVRGRAEPSPRDRTDAERAVGFLWTVGFDVASGAEG